MPACAASTSSSTTPMSVTATPATARTLPIQLASRGGRGAFGAEAVGEYRGGGATGGGAGHCGGGGAYAAAGGMYGCGAGIGGGTGCGGLRHLLRGAFGEEPIQFGQVGRDLGELLGHRGEIGREPGNDGVLRCGHAVMVAICGQSADE